MSRPDRRQPLQALAAWARTARRWAAAALGQMLGRLAGPLCGGVRAGEEGAAALPLPGPGHPSTERLYEGLAEGLPQCPLCKDRLEQILAAQEEERRRLAYELHDAVGQALTALLLGLAGLEWAPTLEAARARAADLRKVAGAAAEEVRRLTRGLRPPVLEEVGLVAAVERYAAEHGRRHGTAVTVRAPEAGAPRFDPDVETALYRIVQEALTNTARHAAARRVDVVIARAPDAVRLVVSDDGAGFDSAALPHGADASTHLGLAGMAERAALLGGSCAVVSRPGAGTTVTVVLPLRQAPPEPEPERNRPQPP